MTPVPTRTETPLRTTLTTLTAVALIATGNAGATTVSQAKREVHRLWGPHANRMLCVIHHESRWNPHAISRTNDHGLVQLNAHTWQRFFGPRWHRVYDPVANVRMGYVVWQRSGFGAWTTARWC